MGVIASAELDLNVVNDAYTVSLSNPVCAIHADFDGSNPKLSQAITTVSVNRGDVVVPFTLTVIGYSSDIVSIEDSYSVDMDKWTLRLMEIPNDALEGYVALNIKTEDGYSTDITWRYTVIRESSMLDWIKDWEGSKTKIGDTYMMTPKMFIGTKSQVIKTGEEGYDLNGVYIGPSSTLTGELSPGIYGYKASKEIFHLNETGGSIGGWQIENGGIQTSDGTLKILAEGTIEARNADQDLMWAIYKSGDAIFAKGNVKLNADGTASFTGTINAADGNIGGWTIGSTTINNGHIGLDAVTGVIGIAAGDIVTTLTVPNYLSSIETNGGVMLYYTNANKYGLVGYNKTTDGTVKVLSVGSTNLIAGWNFDDTSLYHVEKVNATRSYTSEAGSITIGTAGLRGTSWYIDNDGVASFAKGLVTFSSTSSSIVGWNLNANRLSTSHIALVSEAGAYGLYISSNANLDFNSIASANLGDSIDSGGGIYIKTNDDHASLAAYNSSGKKLFKLRSNGVSSIAGWNFDDATLYSGTAQDTAGSYTLQSSDITIGINGIRGYKWRLEADGSGAIGGGHVWWNADGDVTMDDTVKLSANCITAGTLSTADIKNSTGTWYLNQDGTGALANGKISWNAEGDAIFQGEIQATKGVIGVGDNAFTISETGLSYGDISDWELANTHKTLITPEFIRIQNQEEDENGSYHRIGLGNNADPSVETTFGTVAFFQKYDMASDFTHGFTPAVRIHSLTRWGYGVGLKTTGAILAVGGPITEKGTVLETDNSVVTVSRFDILNGSSFVVSNQYEGSYVYLPDAVWIRRLMGITDTTGSCVYTIKFVVDRDSVTTYLHSPIDNVPMWYNFETTETLSIRSGYMYTCIYVQKESTSYWEIFKS